MPPITAPRLGTILSQVGSHSKRDHTHSPAAAKERAGLLSQYPALRRRRESETWLLPQLIYHWALCMVEQRPMQWEAAQRYWSSLTGYSVTTTSQNYAALSQADLLDIQARGPKGWNGWQTHVLRPGRALLPAIRQKARRIRAELTRAARYADKKAKLLLTPRVKKDSEVSDNLKDKGPSGGFFTQLGKAAFSAMIQVPLRAPPPNSTA